MRVDVDSVIGPRPSKARRTGIGMAWSPPNDSGKASPQDLAHRLLGTRSWRLQVLRVAEDVAAVDAPDVTAVEERAANVEIAALEVAYDAIARLAHRRRRARLVVGRFLDRIGRAEGRPRNAKCASSLSRSSARLEERKVLWPCFGAMVRGRP